MMKILILDTITLFNFNRSKSFIIVMTLFVSSQFLVARLIEVRTFFVGPNLSDGASRSIHIVFARY